MNSIGRAVILGEPRIRFPELAGKITIEADDNDILELSHIEKMQILRALKKTNGKIGGKDGAAALLGFKRTTLIHRMKILGITIEKKPA
ncbi:MAG: hypothetical protein KJN62_00845 [Deltaproteobacteria bacterium]|nr:hypothetical protein [Deltaproteobacteria bacterium]